MTVRKLFLPTSVIATTALTVYASHNEHIHSTLNLSFPFLSPFLSTIQSTTHNIYSKNTTEFTFIPEPIQPQRRTLQQPISTFSNRTQIPSTTNINATNNTNTLLEIDAETTNLLTTASAILQPDTLSTLSSTINTLSTTIQLLSTATPDSTLVLVAKAKQQLHDIIKQTLSMEETNSLIQSDVYNQVSERVMSEFNVRMADTIATLCSEYDKVILENDKRFLKVTESVKKETSEKYETLLNELELQKSEWKLKSTELLDKERQGRLSRLDYLNAKLVELDRIVVKSSDSVVESRRIQQMHQLVCGLKESVEGNQSLSDCISALDKLCTDAMPLTRLVMESIGGIKENRRVYSFYSLEDRFQSVRQRLTEIAFMPSEGGLFSFALSRLISPLLFVNSVVKGGANSSGDVLSIVSRASSFLSLNDVDAAARELNQLKGWHKVLVGDWLDEAREYLKVRQAVDLVEAELGLVGLRFV